MRVLDNRIKEQVEQQLTDLRSGFKKEHSMQDYNFTLSQISEKILENDLKAHMAFTELEKAFGSDAKARSMETSGN